MSILLKVANWKRDLKTGLVGAGIGAAGGEIKHRRNKKKGLKSSRKKNIVGGAGIGAATTLGGRFIYDLAKPSPKTSLEPLRNKIKKDQKDLTNLDVKFKNKGKKKSSKFKNQKEFDTFMNDPNSGPLVI